jgi:hypothetical protein
MGLTSVGDGMGIIPWWGEIGKLEVGEWGIGKLGIGEAGWWLV